MVQPQAEQRVVQVVVAGDRGEHPLDGSLLLLARPRRRRGLRLFFEHDHGASIVSLAEDAGQAWYYRVLAPRDPDVVKSLRRSNHEDSAVGPFGAAGHPVNSI